MERLSNYTLKSGVTVITFLLFTFFDNDHLLALGVNQVSDSIVIQEFDGSIYRSSSYNYIAVEDEDGIIYVGNENGLLEFDGTHWQLYQTPYFTPVSNLKIIEDKIYTVGNNEIGYFQRDSSGVMRYISIRGRVQDETDMPYIHFIEEMNGKVYFNSLNKIYVWDGEIVGQIPLQKESFLFKIENQLIISSFNKGLAILENDSVIYKNETFSFVDDAAYEIIQDNQGRWLIFTSERGFYEFDPQTFETKIWDTDINEHFLQDSIYFYSAERFRDSLFIASSWEKGIVVFNNDGEILYKFDDKTGIKTNYFNIPTIDRRGNIWLSNPRGLTYLKWVDQDEKFSFDPTVLVRYIKIKDSILYIKNSDQVVELDGEDMKSMSLYFSVPSFVQQDLEYSYYLEGFDDSWSPWSTDSRKEYTNLPGGKYKFLLKARDILHEDLAIKPFEFQVVIPILWYENQYYIGILFVSLFIGVFGFIRLRTHSLSQTNKKLEQVVEERTFELRNQQEQLKLANAELKTINNELDNFVYRSSHDLVAPLKSLRGLIAVAKLSTDSDELETYFKLMNTSINKLEEFIRSIMDFSTNTNKPIEKKLIKLDHIVEGILQDLKFYENADEVIIDKAFDHSLEIETDPKRLNIVLSNLITNAVKYHNFQQEADPFIKICANEEDGFYTIEVEDNGLGIPDEFHDKIFDMFFRANHGSEGSGLGLYIVVDTLHVLKGSITFTSKSRVGTKFTVKLPRG